MVVVDVFAVVDIEAIANAFFVFATNCDIVNESSFDHMIIK